MYALFACQRAIRELCALKRCWSILVFVEYAGYISTCIFETLGVALRGVKAPKSCNLSKNVWKW